MSEKQIAYMAFLEAKMNYQIECLKAGEKVNDGPMDLMVQGNGIEVGMDSETAGITSEEAWHFGKLLQEASKVAKLSPKERLGDESVKTAHQFFSGRA